MAPATPWTPGPFSAPDIPKTCRSI